MSEAYIYYVSFNFSDHNVSFDIADCRTNKYLCNKIWQASKYMLLMVNEDQEGDRNTTNLSNLDRWILSRLSRTVETVNTALAERNFHKAAVAIRQFLHYEFCDFYLVRISKDSLDIYIVFNM